MYNDCLEQTGYANVLLLENYSKVKITLSPYLLLKIIVEIRYFQ